MLKGNEVEQVFEKGLAYYTNNLSTTEILLGLGLRINCWGMLNPDAVTGKYKGASEAIPHIGDKSVRNSSFLWEPDALMGHVFSEKDQWGTLVLGMKIKSCLYITSLNIQQDLKYHWRI